MKPPVIWLAFASLVVAFTCFLLARWLERRAEHIKRIEEDRNRRSEIVKRAQQAENEAEALALSLGYTIADRQVRRSYELIVDDAPHNIELRADLLLSREDKLFVAEVKSGERAPDLHHGPTRRQLLEYAYVFDLDEILLFDMEAKQAKRISFPNSKTPPVVAPTEALDPPETAASEPPKPPSQPEPAPPKTEGPALGVLTAGFFLGLAASTIQPVDVFLHKLSDLLVQTLNP